MNVMIRGIKDAFRNSVRSIAIIFILAISICLSVVMLISLNAVETKIANVKSTIGNYITISPAGIRGFEGGGELLNESDVATISQIPDVSKVIKTVSDRITPDTDTNLQSAIEPGSFGNRQQQREVPDNNTSDDNNAPREMIMPVMITGTNDLSVTSNLNVSKFDITAGVKFEENSSDLVALVGTTLASKNNLSVGSTFQAHDQDIKVVGIFDGGNTFANATIVMPIKAVQSLSGQQDQISSLVIGASSIDKVSEVENNIKTQLGTKVDVVSSQDSSAGAIKPLENIKTISLYSLIGAIIAGAIIIFLTMVMIVRERKREIGVLKAIGASNMSVVMQFIVESLSLTTISSVVGIIVGIFLSNPILKVMVNSSSATPQSVGQGEGIGRMMRAGANFGSSIQNTLRDISAVVDYRIILYGLLAAIIIALLGTIIPAFIIAKIRPAEAMRAE